MLSTTLLAILLLPWLKAERANRSSPAHISIVGSGTHTSINARTWDGYVTKDGGVLAHFRDPKNWPGPDGMYGSTKMMVHYAAAELAKLAKGKNNRYVTRPQSSFFVPLVFLFPFPPFPPFPPLFMLFCNIHIPLSDHELTDFDSPL